MDRYMGHICAPTCNKGMPITCWSCLGLWFLECLKDRKDIKIWIDHYKMIPSSQIFFGNESCFRFICPICVLKRMNGELFFSEKNGTVVNTGGNIDELKLEISSMNSKISNENAALIQRIDELKTLLFSH